MLWISWHHRKLSTGHSHCYPQVVHRVVDCGYPQVIHRSVEKSQYPQDAKVIHSHLLAVTASQSQGITERHSTAEAGREAQTQGTTQRDTGRA